MTRLRQCVFLDALPGSSLAINCGDMKRFGELCDLHGDGSYTFLIQLGSLPKGRHDKMGGAHSVRLIALSMKESFKKS